MVFSTPLVSASTLAETTALPLNGKLSSGRRLSEL
jgi:hypothetical protein